MPDLVEPLRRIIETHRATGRPEGGDVSCSCGAQKIPDHTRHVAEQIIDRLGLRPESVDEAKRHIRYATAWFDWELTKFEGAQC